MSHVTTRPSTRRGSTAIDITGLRSGRLVAISSTKSDPKRGRIWSCLCDCGTLTEVFGSGLRGAKTLSCGCLRKERLLAAIRRHGATGTSLYMTWSNMVQRCTNPRNPKYPYYGARGITVCAQWRNSFSRFQSDVGERPSSMHSIDRMDNARGYEPSNCRWATRTEQQRNMRSNRILTLNGVSQCVTTWAQQLNLPVHTIRRRLAAKWPTERVLAYEELNRGYAQDRI